MTKVSWQWVMGIGGWTYLKGGSAMDRWEYTLVDVSRLGKDVGDLNRLGADGWEAVGMVSTWGAREWRFVHPVVLLKRPLPSGQ